MEMKIAVSALCMLASTHLMAIKKTDTDKQMDDLTTRYETAIDSLVAERDAAYSAETLMNPRLIRLFGKATLYKSSVSNALKADEAVQLYASADDEGCLALATDTHLARQQQIEDAVNQAVLYASMTNPEDFSYTEEKFNENVTVVESVEKQQVINNIQPTAILLSENQQNQAVGVDMKVQKPNFWITSGEGSLQFTQNYVSGNWSQGGENTHTLVSWLILNANYNDKQKIQWDNKFEARLGFTTAPSDKEHDYRTTDNMIRLTSKLLLKAIRSWNYSFQVDSKTQSLRNYPANSDQYTAAFLAPLETKVGIGMDYKKSWKSFNISVNIAPLSYRWVYVSEKFLAGRYGIKNGHRSLQEYGSNLTVNSSWQLAKNIRWTSHIDAFTSYEKMVANWENTFDFAVSKYLSTKLFMHGRFDDGVKRKEGYSYFQFKEFLQFGFSYKW